MSCGEYQHDELAETHLVWYPFSKMQQLSMLLGQLSANCCLTCCRSVEVGIHGYWGSYANIFELTRQLGIYPFTDWTPSNQYSPEGLEVVAPIFRVSAAPSPIHRLRTCTWAFQHAEHATGCTPHHRAFPQGPRHHPSPSSDSTSCGILMPLACRTCRSSRPQLATSSSATSSACPSRCPRAALYMPVQGPPFIIHKQIMHRARVLAPPRVSASIWAGCCCCWRCKRSCAFRVPVLFPR